MRILNSGDIMETIEMTDEREPRTCRTVTMGISLLDCADPDGQGSLRKNLRQDRLPRQRSWSQPLTPSVPSTAFPSSTSASRVTPIAMLLALGCQTPTPC